jgi:hypothetical protein
MALLMECLSLFERSAGSLSLDNLKDAVDEFRELKFHSGSVQLALAVAKYSDPTSAGLRYAAEGQPKDVFSFALRSDNRIPEQHCTKKELVVTLSFLKYWKISKALKRVIRRHFNVSARKRTN